eukprot:8437791-Alexandrium_andersonii.AAC.1
MSASLVGSEMCIRDRCPPSLFLLPPFPMNRPKQAETASRSQCPATHAGSNDCRHPSTRVHAHACGA